MNAAKASSILYLDGVSVSFDGFKALNSLSLIIEPGEMRAIIGPNGAGKTTMMDVITGKTRPDEGEIFFNSNIDLTQLDEADIASLGIGRKFQKPTVFESHTVETNIELALANDRRALKTLFWHTGAEEQKKITDILKTVRLEHLRDELAANLSHGQKQWLEIGMLLAQNPKVLLVDEPVAGMTDAETEETASLLKEIAKTHSVIVVEHDMAFVRELGVKVTVLAEGSVLAEGTIDQVSADKKVIDVYLGSAKTDIETRKKTDTKREILSVKNVDLFYGAAQALKDVSLKAELGKVTCLMGRNGVGKTTLLRAIAGQLPIRSGTISLDGQDISSQRISLRAKGGIAYVPQGREIFPLLTVQENLHSGFGTLAKGEKKVPEEIFELFPVLKDMLKRRGGDLSGGQQQQLAIARALITKPKLLLLDEPTEGIQPNIIQDIEKVIALLRDRGEMAIVLVEQDFYFAQALADEFAVMDRGEIVLSGHISDYTEEDIKKHLTV